jgi:hypothetical protein
MFSDRSYGFRSGRSAHQAVAAAQKHVASGYRCGVDLDVEKFFDRASVLARIDPGAREPKLNRKVAPRRRTVYIDR